MLLSKASLNWTQEHNAQTTGEILVERDHRDLFWASSLTGKKKKKRVLELPS